MNHTTKTTTRLGTTAIAAIATVTLALLATAAIVVSVMPTLVQTAHAKCITNPKNGAQACSGGGSPTVIAGVHATTSSQSPGTAASSGISVGIAQTNVGSTNALANSGAASHCAITNG